MAKHKPGTKVGYLGGGQLARMLCESAAPMGLAPFVLSENSDDPAAQVTQNWISGSLKSEQSLVHFLKQVDFATFESEFLDSDLLTKASEKSGTPIYPSPQLMGLLQDRQSQKQLLDRNKLSTAPWQAVNSEADIFDFVNKHKLPVVFKKRFFGYDGYGTFIVKTKKDLKNFVTEQMKPALFIVEKFIPFKKECAIIIGRSRDGSFTHLPFVESHQKDARCDWVKGPIKLPQSQKTIKALKSFLQKTRYVGVMGVEFFLTTRGLMINEIAPRVHNTGHYSQDTLGPSQFDLHNRCILGDRLPAPPVYKGGFAMKNLIGSGKDVQLKPVDGLHWYGKKDNRKGRKMGHVNAVASTPSEALKAAEKAARGIQL